MTHLQQLERELGNHYSRTYKANVKGQCRRFIAVVGEKPTYSRADITGYVDRLIKNGQNNASIRMALSCIKVLCRAIDCPYPVTGAVHLPRVAYDPQQPTLEPLEVRRLIAGAKREDQVTRAIVALATLYGFRAIELTGVINRGCDGTTVALITAKTATERAHHAPTGVESWLTCPPTPMSQDLVHDCFQRLMKRYVRKLRPREGWHAVRRALATGLFLALPHDEPAVLEFMGWQVPGSPRRRNYYKPSESQKQAVWREIDRKVYQVHPFIRYWLQPADEPLPGFEVNP